MLPKSRFLFKPEPFLKAGVFFLLVLVASVVIFSQQKKTADAQIVNFYAGTCLGGWSNVQNATGKPDVTSNDENYSAENSAVYEDNAASIYCGDFTGELPPDTKHSGVTLRFSWTQHPEQFTLPEIRGAKEDVSSSTTPIDSASTTATSSDSNQNSEPIEPEISPVEILVPPDEVEAPVEVIEDSPEQIESEPDTPEPAESEPEPSGETVSWWNQIVPIAQAQEVGSTSESEVVIDAQFEVLYTLDGNEWKTLAYVSEVTNDLTLVFPDEVFASTADISRVQISVKPLLRIEEIPKTYLDAVWLEVSYAPVALLGITDTIVHTPSTYPFSAFGFSSTTDNSYVADVATTSAASSTLSATTSTSLTITMSSVVVVYGIDDRYILMHTNPHADYYELWLFDMLNQVVTKIADNTVSIGEHRAGVKDSLIFWYSQNRNYIYTYDLRTAGTYHQQQLVGNLPASDEPLVFTFPFTAWELVAGATEFTFRSPETGEVFSDGDNVNMEYFKRLFKLESLSDETLQSIGLPTR